MRESKVFAKRSRTRASYEAVKKYFFVFEGKETEVRYFNAMIDLRQEIGINPIIELKPLLRSYTEEGWSNPKKILQRVIQNIDEGQTGRISYETLLNRVMDYLCDEQIILPDKSQMTTIWSILTLFCKRVLHKRLSDIVDNIEDVCDKVTDCLETAKDIQKTISNISDIISNQNITYDAELDKICLIVDRDRDSFVSHPHNNQYEYVLQTCRDRGFGFYLTNPCFEFWLLLHFDEVLSLDKNDLLDNPKVTSRKRFAEIKLAALFPNYSKSSYNAHQLLKSIDKAIKNEKKFCEDINDLECNVGSNIGLLIEEMRA